MSIGLDKIKLFEKKIFEAENIVIIPHVNADGDAIGSILGLYNAIKNTNPNIRLISPNKYPDFLKWMHGNEIIEVYDSKKESPLKHADLIISVDFNALNRLGELREDYLVSNAYKILIDHHPYPDNFANLIFSDIRYSSTAEFIYEILKKTEFGNHINKKCAECLFAGIMTDTGSFSFNSSNPSTYRVVAELLEKGVDKDFVFNQVYNNFSENRMKFLGNSLLNGMTYLPDYKTGYIVISKEDRKQFKEQTGDTENFVNYPLAISGCVFSAIFIERSNFIKLSFRSKGSFSAGKFAEKYFNGGGHKNASGGETAGSLEKAVKKFLNSLEKYKNELNSNE